MSRAILLLSLFMTSASFAEERYGKDPLIPGVHLGVKLTAIGVPVPFRAGLEAKWLNLFGAGIDYGFLPSLSFSNVSVKMSGIGGALRFYPWRRAFFLGVGFGKQNFKGSMTDTFSGAPATVTLDFDTTYIAPQLGWRWCGESGFFFGMELGVQIPMSTSSTTSTDVPGFDSTAQGAALITQINDKANTFGNSAFPHFALLQFGWFI